MNDPLGVWLTHYYDGSGSVVPFADELSALRHAHAESKSITFCLYGQSINEAIQDSVRKAAQ